VDRVFAQVEKCLVNTMTGKVGCLTTLCFQFCDCGRMTRSRCGSLGLHHMALSSIPPRRFRRTR